MQIDNSAETFFELCESGFPFDLEDYHQAHPRIFDTYFNGYCRKTDDKVRSAVDRYSGDYERLKEVAALLPDAIQKAADKAESYFGFAIDVPVHIFVGVYASNAFVDHQAEIYLAVEKLDPDPELLQILIAHEMVHSYHYHVLDRAGIDWESVDWMSGQVSMYLEGVATYLSEQLIPGYPRGYYFSYDKNGADWLAFAENHLSEMAYAFEADLNDDSTNVLREWFRLSGGSRFGYSRLGYFLGTRFVSDLCLQMGEEQVLALLANGDVEEEVIKWINQQM
ncbi:MAG TPA: aminopeptidase [Bacillales bacterium]|nr:aminopeptidase [Bacillales bacterium]